MSHSRSTGVLNWIPADTAIDGMGTCSLNDSGTKATCLLNFKSTNCLNDHNLCAMLTQSRGKLVGHCRGP